MGLTTVQRYCAACDMAMFTNSDMQRKKPKPKSGTFPAQGRNFVCIYYLHIISIFAYNTEAHLVDNGNSLID